MKEKRHKILFSNISELLTCAPLTLKTSYSSLSTDDLGIVYDAWLLVEDGKVLDFGSKKDVPIDGDFVCHDVAGSLVLPGLVDSHTHPLYAGRRDREFIARTEGASYAQIADAGGGIQTTVRETREASNEELYSSCLSRLQSMLRHGVTTVEAKTGYALSIEEELRHLRVLSKVSAFSTQKIVRTCLALHAIPVDISVLDFVSQVETKLLPIVAEQSLADYVDMFIEKGFYSTNDCEGVAKKTKELGLGLRVHADEFSHSYGAQFAAKWKAASADHLQFATLEDFKSLKKSSTVATILPGTSLCTQIPYTQTQSIKDAGCAIAVATDHNPGSCVLNNLSMVATLASLYCGLSYAEAVAAVTYIPALSLSLEKTKGALAKGFDADLTIWPYQYSSQWLEGFGQKRPKEVWIKGCKQF